MPSSTSSFERAIPAGAWGKTWLLALVLFAVAIGLAEHAFRAHGHLPNIVDNEALWAYHRGRVYSGGKKTLVLLGSSRIQLGVDVAAISSRLPDYEVVQLAIDGKTPIAAFRDLALDEKFLGTIIIDMPEHGMERAHWPEQEPWVRYFHDERNLTGSFERRASWYVQSKFVVVDPYVGFNNVLETWLAHNQLPKPNYLTTHLDRSRTADYSMIDIVSHRAQRVSRLRAAYLRPPPSPEAWMADAKQVAEFAARLGARGGQSVFLRMPTTGEHWQLDSQRYPREKYWDAFAAMIPAAVHFKDEPTLDQFNPPDTSHLDKREATLFSHCLVDVLIKRALVNSDAKDMASACPHRDSR